MKTVLNIIADDIRTGFEKAGYDPALGIVTVSDRPDLCQFQCNGALTGAKQYHKSPMIIAQDVQAVLGEQFDYFTSEAVKPGFINISLTDKWMADYANEMSRDSAGGLDVTSAPETIVIDYGGPNVAKPLHIGHLRAAIIGESLKRIMRKLGHNVIGDVHLGDWGLQMGLVVAELSERYPEWPYFNENADNFADFVPDRLDAEALCEVYPFASAKSKTDEVFKEKAHEYTVKLQNRDPRIIALWQRIMEISVGDLKNNYNKLNVSFDLWLGESDADKYMDETIGILQDKNLLRESQGAKVVDVALEDDKYEIPPVIVVKSDNAVNYEATDIATLLQREKDFHPDRVWYVVDNRQHLHFVQVFRAARKAGIIPENTELEHLGFGTMNGTDGKPFKTRDGGVLRLDDLITMVVDSAAGIMKSSEYINQENLASEAEKVGIASIKFGDLINHRSKDYVFDINKFMSFEGKTGTYILYTLTRINSILEKAGVTADSQLTIGEIRTGSEKELLTELITNSEAFALAAARKAPNYICEKTYSIASAFSHFYRDNKILSEEDDTRKETLLAICILTKKTLEMNLEALAIEPVNRM